MFGDPKTNGLRDTHHLPANKPFRVIGLLSSETWVSANVLPVLKAATLQIVIELPLNIAGQRLALRCHCRSELTIVPRDETVEQRVFRAVTYLSVNVIT